MLVSPLPVPPLVDTTDSAPPQQQFYINGNVPELDAASMEEKRLASNLSYLASQHHTSEYNRLKFGPGGAAAMYIPLSIQVPAHVRELKARQALHAQKKVWWPANTPHYNSVVGNLDHPQNHVQKYKPEPSQQENTVLSPQVVYGTGPVPHAMTVRHGKPYPTLHHPPTLNLQRELSMAMSSPLSIITIPQLSPQIAFQQPYINLHAKTSESHPINISPIIPFEFLPLITSHLVPTARHASHMFDLPPSLLLHHLVAHSPGPASEIVRPYPSMRVTNGRFLYPTNTASPVALDRKHLDPYGMCQPLHVTTTKFNSPRNGHVQNSCGWLQTCVDSQTILSLDKRPQAEPDQPSDRLGPSSSPPSPPIQGRPHSAPPSLLSLPLMVPQGITNGLITSPPPLPEVVHAMSSHIFAGIDDGKDAEKLITSQSIIGDISPPISWAFDIAPSLTPPLRPTLGNILLSSCPGKKVRLSGPVKGRGAICRDLGHDLRRVKALGVGCIICCLDDEELEFLGASWPQYSEIARVVGLDVLRIPIPEGLTPIGPALFEQHLSYIIHSYTLQGIPVLVHCRGGVGRAGLVACCWMLKLGLCGWLTPVHEETAGSPVMENGRAVVKVRRDTVELVERVIGVVRRRRSVKAIETYEQVRFLVEFVEHLKGASGSRRGP